jgi:DTW domain-containing protein YfiP
MAQRRFAAERCADCGLHPQLCACAERPSLELQTALLIVQSNKERNKPTNTARMLPQLLRNAELLRHGARPSEHGGEPGVELDRDALRRPERDYLLIFPRVDDPDGPNRTPAATLDAELLARRRAARPDAHLTIVLLDGTWAQCSRMSRRVPELAAMQAVALPDGVPSHWGVRRASDPSRLSTFEAAIRVIELCEGPAPALTMQIYFDRVAAAMLFMKSKLRSPEVPAEWIAERERRFAFKPAP